MVCAGGAGWCEEENALPLMILSVSYIAARMTFFPVASEAYEQLAERPAFVQRLQEGRPRSHPTFLCRQSEHDKALRRRLISEAAVLGEELRMWRESCSGIASTIQDSSSLVC